MNSSSSRLIFAGLALSLLSLPAFGQPPYEGPKPRTPTTPPKTVTPSKPASGTPPRLVPVAETKLLMEGMTHTNFQGIEKILKGTSIDPESWGFARGQAILIAESGNLLMLRPPRNSGQDLWLKT